MLSNDSDYYFEDSEFFSEKELSRIKRRETKTKRNIKLRNSRVRNLEENKSE